jgi:hypothetical protein
MRFAAKEPARRSDHVYCWKSIAQNRATDASRGKAASLPQIRAYFTLPQALLLIQSAAALKTSATMFSIGDQPRLAYCAGCKVAQTSDARGENGLA